MREKRVRGCPNERCELHVKKKRQKPDTELCPLCQTPLIDVCRQCFRPLAEDDYTTMLCLDCLEAQVARREKQKALLRRGAERAENAMLDLAVPLAIGTAEVVISRGGKGVVKIGKQIVTKAAKTMVKKFR